MTHSSPDSERANTDREIWRGPDEGNGSYYADSIHVTEGGGIGINVGGHVIVMPIYEWHALATGATAVKRTPAQAVGEPVAWRWRHKDIGVRGGLRTWNYSQSEMVGDTFESEPLFAAPPERKGTGK